MKKVLLIESHQLFRDFLKQKLSSDQIDVILTQENRDSYTKMISILPNLIILDMGENYEEEMEFLQKKAEDPNTINIPVIVTGPSVEKSSIASLAKYGVIKYFAKPIQFDVFFDSIGNVLKYPLSMDLTPSVLDLHRNGEVIFIELALGLNREKIALLQYKLTELIEQEEIDTPKIVIMLTSLDLTFVDGYNLEFLIDNIIACPRVHNKNVKVLSLSQFVRDLVDGHPAYDGIEVASNLPKVLKDLVDTSVTSNVSDLITDKILTSSTDFADDGGSVETRFYSDISKKAISDTKDGTVLHVAVIDSDPNYQKQTEEIFLAAGASVKKYSSGTDFLNEYQDDKFNLIIIDVVLKDNSGIKVLQVLQSNPRAPVIIVYSQSLQKDIVIKVISLGAKSYLVKPQKPNVIIQKSLSLLKG